MALQRRYAALDLAERLTQRRAELGLTQEDAVEAICKHGKITLRAYQRWELGEAVPQDRNVYNVAKAFGLDPAELIIEPPAPNHGASADQLDRIEQKLDELLELLAQERLVERVEEALQGRGRTRRGSARAPASKKTRTAKR